MGARDNTRWKVNLLSGIGRSQSGEKLEGRTGIASLVQPFDSLVDLLLTVGASDAPGLLFSRALRLPGPSKYRELPWHPP